MKTFIEYPTLDKCLSLLFATLATAVVVFALCHASIALPV
jgi:hypothetical protein